MDIKELKDIALELMDALAAKKLGEVELELDARCGGAGIFHAGRLRNG